MSATQYQPQQQNRTTERFSQMNSTEFTPEVEKLWLALTELKDAISREVEAEHIPPVDGLNAIAHMCVSILGYQRPYQSSQSSVVGGSDRG